MTAATCPFCNAVLGDSTGVCRVCGEALPGHSPTATTIDPKPRNRRTALLVVTVMAGCALMALTYALVTQPWRRANDIGAPPRPPRSPFDPTATAPDQLAALTYLPAGCDLLVGLRFAGLYDDPAMRALLDQPLPVGKNTIRLADLRTWIGLEPEQIDHAVLGLALPRIVLIVRTRGRTDAEVVRKALKATPVVNVPLGETRTLYNAQLGGLNLPVARWFADERTIALSLTDFTAMPAREGEHLSASMRTLLRQRLDPGCAVWSAGLLRGSLQVPAQAAIAGVLGEQAALAGVSAYAAGLVPGKEIIGRLDLEMEKAAIAEALAERLRGKEPTPNLKVETDGVRVLLQWKTTLAELTKQLGQKSGN